ncbi:MAG: DUF2752 domain-containing protein [Bacteroidales bacterium]|nr:DUF2752 domain-containing protein [Bacteroidales bacterium]
MLSLAGQYLCPGCGTLRSSDHLLRF